MTTAPTDGFHAYGTADTAPHPVTEKDMDKIREHAVIRLTQLGATGVQAQAFVDEHGPDIVRSESNDDLKARIKDLPALAFDPKEHNIDDVLTYVGDDRERAVQVLAAEAGSKKPRKTLVEALEELSTPSDPAVLGSPADGGVESEGDDGPDAD